MEKGIAVEKIIDDFKSEKDYRERFVVIGIVNGAHYELSWQNWSCEKTHNEAYELMLTWKDSFNKNEPFLFSARLGTGVDIIRTDTIEKMYIRRLYIQRDDVKDSEGPEPTPELG